MEKVFEKFNFNWSDDSNRLILTPSLFALNNLFYIQEIGEFKTLPGYFAEREGLDSFLLVLTLSGKGELRYGGETYTALPGTFFWIDCEARHSYRNLSSWRFLWLHFGGASSKGFYRHWSRTHTPAASAPERMQSDFETLLTLGRIPSPAGELECNRVINRMLTDILLADFSAPFAADSAPGYLAEILHYLDRHFREDVSLKRLAEEFHVNSFYISREFKKYIGIGYREYLNRRRIDYTKNRLKYTDAPVEQIAEDAGFPSASYYIAAFKKATGVTPLKFRKQTQTSK